MKQMIHQTTIPNLTQPQKWPLAAASVGGPRRTAPNISANNRRRIACPQ
jgi:hypothetical protein